MRHTHVYHKIDMAHTYASKRSTLGLKDTKKKLCFTVSDCVALLLFSSRMLFEEIHKMCYEYD